ncbi:MAG: HDOD domain-containing protein, partial [Cellulomonadaceae bacterium]|nr:HDOD domain-containing protein [Cellulomonadaceae bacterium]
HLFEPPLGEVVRAAHAAGTRVLATGVHDALTEDLCRLAAVDGLRGGSDHRAAAAAESSAPKVLRAGQLQCLAALHLLNKGDVDLGEVGQVIDTDPVLTLRVLHLVNSGAFALRREIDTVQHAVVLLGVREIANLVTALAIDARPDAMDSLWRILARALTCELLSGDPAGYTVGMLSALIGELGVPADVVLDKVGVSPAVADAVRALEGPMGQVLAAVLAHERNDAVGVVWAGYSHVDVSDAYVACLADALATVRTINPA